MVCSETGRELFGWFLPLAVRAGLITWQQRLDATVAEVERWPLCRPYYEMRRDTDLWIKSQVMDAINVVGNDPRRTKPSDRRRMAAADHMSERES